MQCLGYGSQPQEPIRAARSKCTGYVHGECRPFTIHAAALQRDVQFLQQLVRVR
jgi:hypothetical protein